MPTSGKSKKSAYNAGYLSGLSQQSADDDIFGPAITQKHQELQQEMATTDHTQVPQIAIDLLQDNPWQGRQSMDEEELKKLAEDIGESGFQGVLVARPHPTEPGAYQLVAGHRRKRASRMAGLTTLPVLVRTYSDEEMLFLQAKENFLREQLTPLDEAHMFRNMLTMGYTQETVAARVRQSRGYVRNRLALLDAPEDVQAMVRKDKDTVRAAYYLREVEDTSARTDLIQAILDKKITGESLPGYIAAMKEEQHREQQRREQVALSVAQSSETHIQESLHRSSELETQGQQPVMVLPAHYQRREGEQQRETAIVPTQERVQGALEGGEKRSQELVEAGRLKAILKQLQNYESRRAKRPALSGEELIVLQAIEELSHRLHTDGE